MGTLKTQKHLEDLLADNSNKNISAEDVRTIVTSNYQPQMILAAFFTDNATTNNYHKVRIMYYNTSYFSDAAITSSSNTACWKVTNAGVGVPDGTYTNQTLTPPATYDGYGGTGYPWDSIGGVAFGATFNFTVSGGSGQISNVECVTGGSGWMPRTTDPEVTAASRPGMVGSFNLSGASTQPTLEFMGPIYITDETDDVLLLDMTTNHTAQVNQNDHFGMNTLAQSSSNSTTDVSNSTYLYAPNVLYVETSNRNTSVALWRMPTP